MKEKIGIQLSLQKHRELAEMAEVATHERIRQLKLSRIREDVSRSLCIIGYAILYAICYYYSLSGFTHV